jgi:hypothetical protein
MLVNTMRSQIRATAAEFAPHFSVEPSCCTLLPASKKARASQEGVQTFGRHAYFPICRCSKPDVESCQLVYIWVDSGGGWGADDFSFLPVFSGPLSRKFENTVRVLT